MAIAAGLIRSAAGRLYWASPHFLAHVRGKVLILMYHRVLPRPPATSNYVQPGMYVTPATFEQHLRFIRAHFEVLPFHDLLQRWDSGGCDDAARYCVLTFDDGWLDNYHYAYPLLRKYAIPATIFLPTDLVGTDTSFWPDRLGRLLGKRRRGTPAEWDAEIEGAKSLPDAERDALIDSLSRQVGEIDPPPRSVINWAEVEELSRHRISFGSHSMTHANLTRLHPAALAAELRGSLAALRAHDGVNWVPVLAYPNGDHTSAVSDAAQAAGFRAAVTTRPGLESNRPGDLYRLKRIGLHEDVSRSIPDMAFQIARVARRW